VIISHHAKGWRAQAGGMKADDARRPREEIDACGNRQGNW
jgi:hypothetical protein